MCGVIGIAIKDFTKEDCDLVRSLFIQSMIRGKHSTGVSYVKNGKVVTLKEPIPANEFIRKQDVYDWRNEDGNLYCIGHVRYSTSDLRYNQPIATEELSIVHNGVISQRHPDDWESLYGYKTETHNDSELILRCMENNENPLIKFHPASMSVCKIDKNKVISAFRNEARPLYMALMERGVVFASTKDIIRRSGFKCVFTKLDMYEVHTIDNFVHSKDNFFQRIDINDLQ